MMRDAPSQVGTFDGGPNHTLAARLHFLWFGAVAVLWTLPMAVVQIVTHLIDPSVRAFSRNVQIWSRVILTLCGVRVHVADRSGIDPSEPVVFVSNHQNLLDILALGAALPYPFAFVAKQELSTYPVLGFAVRNSASVFIDRSDPRRAVESLKRAGERVRGGSSVLVFAEGKRSFSRELQPLKKGAFAVALEAGVALVPVTIVDAYRLMDERRRLMRGGRMHIVLGEVISLEGKTRRNIPELMAAMRERLADALAEHNPKN